MITYTTGNLFDSDKQTLINTVNLVGVMGKGIALQFKQRYPEMYAAYRISCNRNELSIGKLDLHRQGHLLPWVLNFPTKRHWRNPSNIHDINKGLTTLRREYARMGITSMAIPPLGCGNGGLAWPDVRRLIEFHLADLPIDITVFQPSH